MSFISFVFLLFVSSYMYADSTSEKITVFFSKIPLSEAIKKIESVSSYTFFYDVDKTDLSQQVSLQSNNQDMEVAIDRMLKSTNLQFEINNRQIILMPKLVKQTGSVQNVRGRVVDENSTPVIGANVSVKGTTNGTISDAEGYFNLTNVPTNATLLISYIGMESQEITVKGNAVIKVVLKEDAVALSDVVVIGYGVTKKADLTGAVSSVSLNDVSRQPVLRLEEALRGKAPGVQITQTNGAPGSNMRIRIRGTNSVNGSNDPLYVVDGFLGADYSMLNPNDIESITILKDASATSMYGSQGSNGVVLITTKSAKEGEMKVEYNGFVSFDQPFRKLDVLDATQYRRVYNERMVALGNDPYYSETQLAATGKGVNWQDEVLRSAVSQNHQLAISGGQSKIKYYLSASYINQEGVVKNSFHKKYGFTGNISSKIRDNFDIVFNMNGNYYESKNLNTATYNGHAVSAALVYPPDYPIFDEDGKYATADGPYGSVGANPAWLLNNGDEDGYGFKVLANLQLNWTIIDGLKLSVSGGTNLISTKSTSLDLNNKDASVTTAIAQAYDGMVVSYQNTNQLSYNKMFNDIHKLDATLVYEQQKYINRQLGAYVTGFSTISLGVNNLGLGANQTASSGYMEWSLQSYLGRVNYTLMDRYLFTASMRIDGSSKFAKGNKYGYFPSGAVAWRLSDEPFIKDWDLFKNLKLRGSYGHVGSQAISPYATLQKMTSGSGQGMNYQFDNSSTSIGVAPSTATNRDLKWETTKQTNVGLDFAILNGRLSGTIDYYYKKTVDLLFNVSVPDYLYGGSVLKNVGSMRNKGWEFMLSGVLVDNKDWFVETSATLSLNRNKVLNMGDEKEIFITSRYGSRVYDNYSVLHINEPIGQMYGLIYLGTWKSSEAAEAAKYGFVPGDSKYVDRNGDYTIDGEDMTVIGNALPKFTYSWNTTVSYKNWDLNILFNGVQGNDIWNFTRATLNSGYVPGDVAVLDRWSPTNEDSMYPEFSNSNRNEEQSNRWIENGSYLRLSNLTLGYIFNQLKGSTFVRDAKIYVSAQNLFTITKYSGYNPESNMSGNNDTAFGYDASGYPAIRSFMVGVKFAF